MTDGEGEGVAEGEHDGGGGGGCEVVRAGFAGDADVERDAGGGGEGGGRAAADGDEAGLEALEEGQEGEELFGFAACGEGDDEVAGGEHAEVAVEGFGGMEEVGGGSGGAEGGGDLAGDDAAFADAGEEDAVMCFRGGDEEVDGLGEGFCGGAIEAIGEIVEGGGFEADDLGRAGWGSFRSLVHRW